MHCLVAIFVHFVNDVFSAVLLHAYYRVFVVNFFLLVVSVAVQTRTVLGYCFVCCFADTTECAGT